MRVEITTMNASTLTLIGQSSKNGHRLRDTPMNGK